MLPFEEIEAPIKNHSIPQFTVLEMDENIVLSANHKRRLLNPVAIKACIGLVVLLVVLIINGVVEAYPTLITDIFSSKQAPLYLIAPGFNHPNNVKLERKVGIHSHNDYWRQMPLFSALSLGIKSVEADVWHFDSEPDCLFVGHRKFKLSKYRTLNTLYLNNLKEILKEDQKHYDDLILIIDIKTSAEATWTHVLKELKPFDEMKWLTSLNQTSGELTKGKLTVVISGNIPLEAIRAEERVITFVDAPLERINEPQFAETYSKISLQGSTSLRRLTGSREAEDNNTKLSERQMQVINNTIIKAHELGIDTRIWGTPRWPKLTRNHIWGQLINVGVDYLNVDDIQDAAIYTGD